MKKIHVQLDWSRLLGFDQVDGSHHDAPALAKVGDKNRSPQLASKVSFKPGSPSLVGMRLGKVGRKPDAPSSETLAGLGAKIGSKRSIRQTR